MGLLAVNHAVSGSNDGFAIFLALANGRSAHRRRTATGTFRVATNCYFSVLNWSAGKPTEVRTRFGLLLKFV